MKLYFEIQLHHFPFRARPFISVYPGQSESWGHEKFQGNLWVHENFQPSTMIHWEIFRILKWGYEILRAQNWGQFFSTPGNDRSLVLFKSSDGYLYDFTGGSGFWVHRNLQVLSPGSWIFLVQFVEPCKFKAIHNGSLRNFQGIEMGKMGRGNSSGLRYKIFPVSLYK